MKSLLAVANPLFVPNRRSAVVHARPLPPLVRPVLDNHLSALLEATKDVFPAFGADPEDDDLLDWEGGSDEETEADLGRLFSAVAGSSVAFVQRPRLLLCGRRGAGQVRDAFCLGRSRAPAFLLSG